MSQLDHLKSRMAQVSDLKAAAALLSWDQQTYMPRGGAEARAEQIATLEKLAHGRFVSEDVGAWLEGAAAETRALAYESDDASLVRLTRRDYQKACRIPPALVEELARQTSLGMEVWVKARAQSDFSLFQGALQTLVDLQRELADCLGFGERRYDALLDQYEPGMQSADLDRLFADLKSGLVPLVQDISRKLDSVQDEVLRQRFPIDRQTAFGLELAQEMGFDLNAGRQDESVHPFCTSFSNRDVRITTRFDEKFLPSALFGTLHETGHALYEQGVSPGPGAHPPERRHLPGHSRVPVADVGKPGGPEPGVLEIRLPAASARLSSAVGRLLPGGLLPGHQSCRAFAHPGGGRRSDLQSAHHAALRTGSPTGR